MIQRDIVDDEGLIGSKDDQVGVLADGERALSLKTRQEAAGPSDIHRMTSASERLRARASVQTPAGRMDRGDPAPGIGEVAGVSGFIAGTQGE